MYMQYMPCMQYVQQCVSVQVSEVRVRQLPLCVYVVYASRLCVSVTDQK